LDLQEKYRIYGGKWKGNSLSGRAEYFNGSEWGTICDDYFNPIAANIFCQSINSYFGFHHLSNIGSLQPS
jgi:hypothetical protein